MAIARLGGRYAALQVNNNLRYQMVIAGGSGEVFNPGTEVAINSVAGTGQGLWLATGLNEQAAGINLARPVPAVIHLNAQLKDTTPASIRKYRYFTLAVELVWASAPVSRSPGLHSPLMISARLVSYSDSVSRPLSSRFASAVSRCSGLAS